MRNYVWRNGTRPLRFSQFLHFRRSWTAVQRCEATRKSSPSLIFIYSAYLWQSEHSEGRKTDGGGSYPPTIHTAHSRNHYSLCEQNKPVTLSLGLRLWVKKKTKRENVIVLVYSICSVIAKLMYLATLSSHILCIWMGKGGKSKPLSQTTTPDNIQENQFRLMSRRSSFTHAENIRNLSACDVFTRVGSSPSEMRWVQAAALQDRAAGHMLATFNIIYRQINYLHLWKVRTAV